MHDIAAVCEIADMVVLLGREADENGNRIPGARVMASYNLGDLGLAWRKGLTSDPEFHRLLEEIRTRFPLL